MKNFKQYEKEKQEKKDEPLSWDSSFHDMKERLTKIKSDDLSWDSSFHDKKGEHVKEEWSWNLEKDIFSHHSPKHDSRYNGEFHDHPDIKPQNLTDEHVQHLVGYTSVGRHPGSSKNMNGFLRRKSGDKKSQILYGTDPKEVEKSIRGLSSAFTPENTNRKEVVTYSGVPQIIGKRLKRGGKGSIHHFAGFTSTSSSPYIAQNFAGLHNNADELGEDAPRHVLKCHLKTGTGLSVVHHSQFSENEVLLHHGAKVEYSHTTTHKKDKHPTIYVHHVIVHPEHKKLEEYGEYT